MTGAREKGVKMGTRWPLLAGVILGLSALVLGFAIGDDTIERWHLAARWTARAGFPLLIAAYVARPLVQLAPSEVAKGLLARRKWFGLGFAASHTVHLGALATFLTITNQPPETTTLIGGGAAYVLLYAMALTSTDAAKRAMGRWWKVLHKVGIHWLWFVFASSYAGRLSDPDRWVIGAVFTPIAFAAAAIRLAAWIKVRRMQSARAVPA